MNRVRKAVFSEAVHKQGILGKGIGIAIVDTGLFRIRITAHASPDGTMLSIKSLRLMTTTATEATLQGLPPEQEPFLMENTKASHRRQI